MSFKFRSLTKFVLGLDHVYVALLLLGLFPELVVQQLHLPVYFYQKSVVRAGVRRFRELSVQARQSLLYHLCVLFRFLKRPLLVILHFLDKLRRHRQRVLLGNTALGQLRARW